MFSTLVDCCQFKVSMHCQSSNFLGSLSQGHPPEHRIFEQSSRWSHFSKVEKAPIKNPLQSCETKMDGFGLNRRGTVVDGTFWVGAHFPIIVVNSRFIFIGIPKPEKCNVILVVTIWQLLKKGAVYSSSLLMQDSLSNSRRDTELTTVGRKMLLGRRSEANPVSTRFRPTVLPFVFRRCFRRIAANALRASTNPRCENWSWYSIELQTLTLGDPKYPIPSIIFSWKDDHRVIIMGIRCFKVISW